MSKRGNGDGTIEKRPNGRYRVRIRDAGGQRVTLRSDDGWATFASYEETEQMLNAALALLDDGEVTTPTGETLATFGERWMDRRERFGNDRGTAVRAIADERNVWRKHVRSAPFYERPIDTITTP